MVKEIFKKCFPGGIERRVCEGPQGIFCGDGTFYILIQLSVAVVYAFVKTHQSVTLKIMSICLFLNYTSKRNFERKNLALSTTVSSLVLLFRISYDCIESENSKCIYNLVDKGVSKMRSQASKGR